MKPNDHTDRNTKGKALMGSGGTRPKFFFKPKNFVKRCVGQPVVSVLAKDTGLGQPVVLSRCLV